MVHFLELRIFHMREALFLFVRLYVAMRSVVMSPLQDVTTFTVDSASAVIVSCFANRIVACSYVPRLDASCLSVLAVWTVLSLPKIRIGVECIGTAFMSIGKVPLMLQSMHVVPSKMLNDQLSTTSSHVRNCRVPFFTINGMITYT